MGRIRQAHGLNENEVGNIIHALWPNNVFPLELWSKADEKFWRGLIVRNASLYNTINLQLPKVDVSDDFIHMFIRRLDTFFNELIFIIPALEAKAGINCIIDETLDKNECAVLEEIKKLFDKLSYIEKSHRLNRSYLTYVATKEEFIAELEEKKISIPPNSRFFIADIIRDTIVVDKAAAIRHLSACGFPLRHEVKGITHSLVESVLNPQTQEPAAPEQTAAPAELTTEVPARNPQDAIPVRRSLWAGKTKEAICADMRKENFDDEFIVHVLLHKRGLKLTQREIGKLLGPPHKSESKYDKLGKELCRKAALVNVIDAPEP